MFRLILNVLHSLMICSKNKLKYKIHIMIPEVIQVFDTILALATYSYCSYVFLFAVLYFSIYSGY